MSDNILISGKGVAPRATGSTASKLPNDARSHSRSYGDPYGPAHGGEGPFYGGARKVGRWPHASAKMIRIAAVDHLTCLLVGYCLGPLAMSSTENGNR